MQSKGPKSFSELRRRDDTLIVSRPFAHAMRVSALSFAMLAIILLGGWALLQVGLAAKFLVGIFVAGAVAMLGFSLMHQRRMGSLYLAADASAIYFRAEEDGFLQEVPWKDCIDVSVALDGRRTKLNFEFEKHDPNWKTLCHATVFYRDTIVVAFDDLPSATSIHARLVALWQSASPVGTPLEEPPRKAA